MTSPLAKDLGVSRILANSNRRPPFRLYVRGDLFTTVLADDDHLSRLAETLIILCARAIASLRSVLRAQTPQQHDAAGRKTRSARARTRQDRTQASGS